MQSMRGYRLSKGRLSVIDIENSGCDPLKPDDIAEVIVFAVGRPENVVVADTLIFPNHQVCGITNSLQDSYTDIVTGFCRGNVQKGMKIILCVIFL